MPLLIRGEPGGRGERDGGNGDSASVKFALYRPHLAEVSLAGQSREVP